MKYVVNGYVCTSARFIYKHQTCIFTLFLLAQRNIATLYTNDSIWFVMLEKSILYFTMLRHNLFPSCDDLYGDEKICDWYLSSPFWCLYPSCPWVCLIPLVVSYQKEGLEGFYIDSRQGLEPAVRCTNWLQEASKSTYN